MRTGSGSGARAARRRPPASSAGSGSRGRASPARTAANGTGPEVAGGGDRADRLGMVLCVDALDAESRGEAQLVEQREEPGQDHGYRRVRTRRRLAAGAFGGPSEVVEREGERAWHPGSLPRMEIR